MILFSFCFDWCTASDRTNEDKCRGLNIHNVFWSHRIKPFFSFLRQILSGLILTGCNDNETYWNLVLDKEVKLFRWLVCFKHFCILNWTILWIDDYDMQSSLVILYIWLDINLYIINHYLTPLTIIRITSSLNNHNFFILFFSYLFKIRINKLSCILHIFWIPIFRYFSLNHG